MTDVTQDTAAGFDAWRQDAGRGNPKLLYLTRHYLMQHAASHITEDQFPPKLSTPDGELTLRYRFEPGHALDGVTVDVPLPLLNRLNPAQLEFDCTYIPHAVYEKERREGKRAR